MAESLNYKFLTRNEERERGRSTPGAPWEPTKELWIEELVKGEEFVEARYAAAEMVMRDAAIAKREADRAYEEADSLIGTYRGMLNEARGGESRFNRLNSCCGPMPDSVVRGYYKRRFEAFLKENNRPIA